MNTNWPANLSHLAASAYDVFLWPGEYVLSQLPQYAPALAVSLGVGIGDDGVALPTIVSVIAWTLVVYAAWKTIKAVCLNVWYGACRMRTWARCKVEARNRRRELSQPVPVPEVEFDDLDIAVLNLGSTIPPGFALTAAELSGQLTRRPAQVQQSLDKLRSYGLIDNAIGSTDGFDNYCLTRTGAAILSMWERNGRLPH